MTNTFHFTFSPPYMTTGKIIALTIWTFVGKMMSLLFITLSRFLIAFLQFSSKASHLTSHSRMSNHTFMVIHVIKTNFIQFFYVVLPPLLYLFCFCRVLAISALFGARLFMKCSLISPVFLTISLVLPFLLFFSISLYCSYKKAFLFLLPILWNTAFSWRRKWQLTPVFLPTESHKQYEKAKSYDTKK